MISNNLQINSSKYNSTYTGKLQRYSFYIATFQKPTIFKLLKTLMLHIQRILYHLYNTTHLLFFKIFLTFDPATFNKFVVFKS